MEVVRLEERDGRAEIVFARADRPVNVLDEATMAGLEAVLDRLERETPRALVFRSDNPRCFVAGADIERLRAIRDPDEGRRLAERGQALMRRVERLGCPTAALVRGSALGGGLELALACDWIVAVDDAATRLGLPEIRLGIHPGFGGTVRLPRRVGWPKALELMLTGRALDARRARRMGLADAVCPPGREEAALADVLSRGKARRRQHPWWFRLPPVRALVLREAEKRAAARFPHLELEKAYPAIPALLALVGRTAFAPEGIAYAEEARSLGALAVTRTCKALIRVFHLRGALRNQPLVKRGEAAAARVERVAVYGAGVMGSGIAWVAAKTVEVDLHDVGEEALARGMRAIAGHAGRDPARLARVRPALDDSGLRGADVVIEAIVEDLEAKKQLFARLEPLLREDAWLLTNTSSLSVSALQEACREPGRVAGMHFFNPAPKMPLVEVVAGERTDRKTLAGVAALAVAWDKLPVVVKDVPGFLVNRCLMPYLGAAFRLVDAGQRPAHVDGALKVYGMPMGALELADRVGLDICLHVARQLAAAYGREEPPAWLAGMVEAGLLGAKGGKGGFYAYRDGRLVGPNPEAGAILPQAAPRTREFNAAMKDESPAPLPDRDIVDACVLPMLAEALACLREGVVASADELDAAFVFGIGFPPFRGGLLGAFADEDPEALAGRFRRQGLPVPANLDVVARLRGELAAA